MASDLYRNAVRKTIVATLRAAGTTAGRNVFKTRRSPIESDLVRDGAPSAMPALCVYCLKERGESLGNAGAPKFKVTGTFIVEALVEAKEGVDLDDALDTLEGQVRDALLLNPNFVALFEEVASFEADAGYEEKSTSIGRSRFGLELVWTELDEPTITTMLAGLNLYIDALNVFDPSGTYSPPFAYTPTAPPRTSGPDGRVEVEQQIDL